MFKEESSDQEQLKENVIKHSVSKKWEKAKKEWNLITIYDQEGNCLCGHSIMENCVIRNKINRNQLVIGNVCINHFKEEHLSVSRSCRTSLKKILQKRTSANANKALLLLCQRLEILSKFEVTTYLSHTTGPGSRNRFKYGSDEYDIEAVKYREKVNALISLGFTPNRPKCYCKNYAKPRQNSKKLSYFYSCANFPDGCKFTQNCKLRACVNEPVRGYGGAAH